MQAKLNNSNEAINFYREGIKALQSENDIKESAGAYISMAALYDELSKVDSAIYFGKLALSIAQ